MKKLCVLLLIAMLVLSCAACNRTVPSGINDIEGDKKSGEEENKDQPTEIVTQTVDIYRCDDVYRTDDTPTHGSGTISIPINVSGYELSDFEILACDDGCNPTDVVSRAFWGYAPAWRIDQYEEYTAEDGWNFDTRKYINEVPEDIKNDMISQGAPDSVTNPRDYIYLLTLDEKHYAYIHLKGKEEAEMVSDEHTIADEFVKKAQIEFVVKNPEDYSLLYQKACEFLEQEFHRVYDPYYDIQSLGIVGWNEEESEATLFYKMTYLHYNRDPNTVEYIKEAKNKNQESYETLYNDYLALHESNYRLKIVSDGETLKLYTDISPKGTEWKETKVDNFVLG